MVIRPIIQSWVLRFVVISQQFRESAAWLSRALGMEALHRKWDYDVYCWAQAAPRTPGVVTRGHRNVAVSR